MEALSTSFCLAVTAVANAVGIPLPAGLSTAEVGDWTLTVNNSRQEIEGLPSFHVKAQHHLYLACALIGPAGGAIGGATEAQFIADMKAAVPAEQWP